MTDRSRLLSICVAAIALLLTVPLAAQPPLLNSSQPGAFGVRYLADRAVITYNVERPADVEADTFTLRVRLPERVQWGFLDRNPIPVADLGWDNGQAVVHVPFGGARVHLGWAGDASLPPESAQIPLFLGEDRIGAMTARFDLEGMQASGEAPKAGPGMADLRVELTGPMDPDQISLSVGEHSVDNWKYEGGALQAREPVYVGLSPRLSLRVERRGLSASPVERVVISNVDAPAVADRVPDDQVPEGVLVEAESFTDSIGTPPQVDPGSHHNTHGGACIYSFLGDGTTITWDFSVPEAGLWDLYLRISCGDVGAWRSVSVDGETPEGLDLLELPGTGGWGHADGEWWIVRITGGEGQPAPLQLDTGEHTLRMTGLLTTHLNIDYLLFAPHE